MGYQKEKMWSTGLFVGFIFLFLQQELVSAEAESEVEGRKPKLFYVTTKSSTSTITTFSLCVQSTNAALTTRGKRRKKRAGLSDPLVESEGMIDISPSEVHSGLENEEVQRSAKFLVYWLTTTSTSFSTSYSSTSTLASLQCTPAGFPYALCGK